MSTLNVDKVDPSTGTALELGTSGDTITVPTGAGLTVVDEVKTNKVSPATGTAFALGDSGDTFTVPSGATIVNSGTATGFGITAASFVPTASPLIINGNMEVAQRGTSQADWATNGGYKTIDRWQGNGQGSFIGDYTQSQSTDVPDGFSKSYKIDCTTADASPSANSSVFFEQRIEAQDCMLFKLGTSDAEIMTLSFWVKATKTGTNIVRIEQEDDQRQCSQAYTVDSTDTWEKKVVTFPADTSGSGITSDNGIGLEVWFYVAAGTTYTSGTLATTWEAVSGNDDNKAVGQVNNGDSTSNDFLITGVQLEVGEYTSSTIPPFRHESYGDNLARCQRYYWNTVGAAHSGGGQGVIGSATQLQAMIECPVSMRANPTGSIAGSGGVELFDASVSPAITSIGSIYGDATDGKFLVDINASGGGLTAGRCGVIYANNSATSGLAWDAEL